MAPASQNGINAKNAKRSPASYLLIEIFWNKLYMEVSNIGIGILGNVIICTKRNNNFLNKYQRVPIYLTCHLQFHKLVSPTE